MASDFGDDLDWDPDYDLALTDLHETFIKDLSLAKDNPLIGENNPDYDQD